VSLKEPLQQAHAARYRRRGWSADLAARLGAQSMEAVAIL